MSIFGSIMGKIFGHAEAAPASTGSPGAPSAPSPTASPTPTSFNNPGSAAPSPGATESGPAPSQPSAGASSAAGGQSVDVAAVLAGMASRNGQTLDWQHSIVDLMKLLGLDSSLSARQELAHELNYTGSTSDSAAMNMWLHKQVMRKLAENGGKVPDDLK